MLKMKKTGKYQLCWNHQPAKNKWTVESFLLYNELVHTGSQRGKMWGQGCHDSSKGTFIGLLHKCIEEFYKEPGWENGQKAKWQKAMVSLSADQSQQVTSMWSLTSESMWPLQGSGETGKGTDHAGRHTAEQKLVSMLFPVQSGHGKNYDQPRRGARQMPSPISGETPDKTGNSCDQERVASTRIWEQEHTREVSRYNFEVTKDCLVSVQGRT